MFKLLISLKIIRETKASNFLLRIIRIIYDNFQVENFYSASPVATRARCLGGGQCPPPLAHACGRSWGTSGEKVHENVLLP